MDAIEGLDDGAYAHFSFQAKEFPAILPFMQPAYYISGYVGVGGLLALVVVILVLQRKWRSALIALLSYVGALCIIELVRTCVPRSRPQDAIFWLGVDAKVGSYPSAGVFLFILCMILLGHALWGLLSPRLRSGYVFIAALLTVWICLGQFFLAIHYVTDVIGGIAGATLIGWIAIRLMERAPAQLPTVPVGPNDAIQDLSRANGIQKP